jgi:nitrogen fixation protein FixH
MLACFTAFVAINLAFVTMAFRHKPQLVSDSYYADGLNLRDLAARRAASNAAGWNVAVRCMPLADSDNPLVEVKVSQSNGSPCDSLTGTAAFYRPSDKTLDVAPQPLQFVGTGRYFVALPHPLNRGAWQALVRLANGSKQADVQVRLYSENQ